MAAVIGRKDELARRRRARETVVGLGAEQPQAGALLRRVRLAAIASLHAASSASAHRTLNDSPHQSSRSAAPSSMRLARHAG